MLESAKTTNNETGKQDEQIFDTALESLDAKPHESVFIDNNESNLIVPREIGMAGIHHDDRTNDVSGIRSQLNSLLNKE